MNAWFSKLAAKFALCFTDNGYWKWLVEGFKNSLIITFFALLIGFSVGVILAMIRSSYDKNEESLRLRGGFGFWFFKILNAICKVYITVIRGVPVVVQLMIWYLLVQHYLLSLFLLVLILFLFSFFS